MTALKKQKMTWQEWSEKLAKEAEGITEAEINEALQQFKAGDYSCIEPGLTEAEAMKLLREVADDAEKMQQEADKLARKKLKTPPDLSGERR